MFSRYKLFFPLIILTILFVQCKSDPNKGSKPTTITNNNENTPKQFLSLSGQTMGTVYNISYDSDINYKTEIDKILVDINDGVSTYISSSTISILNTDSLGKKVNGEIIYELQFDNHFMDNFINSKIIYERTDQYFDPTIMPLVNYWGFGYTKKRPIEEADKSKIEMLKSTVDFSKWSMVKSEESFEIRKPENSKLDFSGIAKGYGVDVIAEFLNGHNIENYMIEIGGEVMVKGKNDRSIPWILGLSKPEINAGFRDFQMLVSLTNVGMASSGNYRNYYKVGGQTYGHEINPKTGYPEINSLLGTSVIAPNCKMADAYATAFMVMGLEKSSILVEELNDLEACFFIRAKNGSIETVNSSGFGKYLK